MYIISLNPHRSTQGIHHYVYVTVFLLTCTPSHLHVPSFSILGILPGCSLLQFYPLSPALHSSALFKYLGLLLLFLPPPLMSDSLLAPTHAFSQALSSVQTSLATPLSSGATAKVDLALAHAWTDSTLVKYRSAVELFLSFCDRENIPRALRLPASDNLLCAFIASNVGLVSGSTVQGYLAVLKAWHVFHNKPWLGSDRLRYVIQGVSNLAPSSSSQQSLPLVSRAMLILLARHLCLTSPLDACCFAAACTAFWAQLRLGEILSPRASSFSAASTVCRSHLSRPLNANGSRKCHLPFTKVRKSRGEDVVICRQADASDPIDALAIHLLVNDPPVDFPLFSYRSGDGWKFLTQQKLVDCCNSVWGSAGLPPLCGHSFRMGGTRELLLAGVPPVAVKTLGRWSSDAFLKYERSIDRIRVAHHVELLSPTRL